MSNIQSTLDTLFQKHRIVFWYDTKREMRSEFESLLLPGVEAIELANNEIAVKYRMLREAPHQKFLLYHAGPEPARLDNWLLDVQLAQVVFQADQVALWLSDLGLPSSFTELAQAHAHFFSSDVRRSLLKAVLIPQEATPISLRIQMLAICSDSQPRLLEILEALLGELAQGKSARMALIQQSELHDFLWEQLKRHFGYQSSSPSLQDFAIALFKAGYDLSLNQPSDFNNEALLFINGWKDSISQHAAFETLSDRCADILNIENKLQTIDYRKVLELDLFRLIDLKVISSLAHEIAARTISAIDASSIIRQRRRGHWYKEFQNYYEVLEPSAQFLKNLDEADLGLESLADGVQRYTKNWYRLDSLYRKVIFYYRKSGFPGVLLNVMETVENHYNNNFLLKVNNNWQEVLDGCTQWQANDIPAQRDFFEKFVGAFIRNKKKVVVLISDAFRYEIANEFLELVRREDRYEAEISAMLGMLPSYTQLGMAALLPNQTISFADNVTGTILVDGSSTQGVVNRERILKLNLPSSSAIKADDFLNMNKDDSRALFRDNDLLYIFHNHIDAVGDKRESEERVFEAVEETLAELLTIIKKLAGANATNILLTADHGFIYQNRPIEESDFSAADVSSAQITYRDRRFVLGNQLPEKAGLKKFSSAQVGLAGETQIQFPKSILRLRLSGSGSRYVHGGVSLQEVIVPVLQINKKRESDISKVQVDIIRGATSLITSGQLAVTIYQKEPVSPKVQARRLRIGIYTQQGVLISNTHFLDFDMESDNPREREIALRLILIRDVNQYNNQDVLLKMEEQVENTTYYQEYGAPLRYTLRRSFTSDFDF